ncbi:hypothetical protein T11_3133 [Trichinella zimbabwensis]|uniref:Uncharacterized protein n=1 Tax=Trichinella zimbabwensis TaxID=268475 RepID=A0A0V1HVA6_9BILA|nr:hypothetical protein T11_3133 [Trichinella zimbabwensis]
MSEESSTDWDYMTDSLTSSCYCDLSELIVLPYADISEPETVSECNIRVQSNYDYAFESEKSDDSDKETQRTSKKVKQPHHLQFRWKKTGELPLIDKNWIELEDYKLLCINDNSKKWSATITMKNFQHFINDDMIKLIGEQTYLNAQQLG